MRKENGQAQPSQGRGGNKPTHHSWPRNSVRILHRNSPGGAESQPAAQTPGTQPSHQSKPAQPSPVQPQPTGIPPEFYRSSAEFSRAGRRHSPQQKPWEPCAWFSDYGRRTLTPSNYSGDGPQTITTPLEVEHCVPRSQPRALAKAKPREYAAPRRAPRSHWAPDKCIWSEKLRGSCWWRPFLNRSSKLQKNREELPFRTHFPKLSESLQLHLNASRRIRTDRNRSQQVGASPKT